MLLVCIPDDCHIIRNPEAVIFDNFHCCESQCVIHGKNSIRRLWK